MLSVVIGIMKSMGGRLAKLLLAIALLTVVDVAITEWCPSVDGATTEWQLVDGGKSEQLDMRHALQPIGQMPAPIIVPGDCCRVLTGGFNRQSPVRPVVLRKCIDKSSLFLYNYHLAHLRGERPIGRAPYCCNAPQDFYVIALRHLLC